MAFSFSVPARDFVVGTAATNLRVTFTASSNRSEAVYVFTNNSLEPGPQNITQLTANNLVVITTNGMGVGTGLVALGSVDLAGLNDEFYVFVTSVTYLVGTDFSTLTLGENYGRVRVRKSAAPVTMLAPGPVTSLSVSATHNSAELSWVEPADTSSTDPATGYSIRHRKGSGAWSSPATLGTGSSHTVTGLDPSSAYTFGVTATNSAGSSAEVTVQGTTSAAPPPPTQPPGPVTGLSASVSRDTATLSWTAPADTSSTDPATSYRVRQRLVGGSWVTVVTTSQTTYVARGLTEGATYQFEVRAQNSAGNSAVRTTTAAIPAPPVVVLPPTESSLRGFSVQLDLLNGDCLLLNDSLKRLKIREGRTDSSRHDSVGTAVLDLEVSPSFLSERSLTSQYRSSDWYGGVVTARANKLDGNAAEFFVGYLHKLSFSPPDLGPLVAVTAELYDVSDFLASADQDIAAPRLSVVEDSASGIDIAPVSTTPRGIVHNDQTLFVVDSGTDRGYAWSTTSGLRDRDKEFALTSANRDPVGICSDGEDIYWVCDSADLMLYAYSTHSRHAADAAHNFRTGRTVSDIGYSSFPYESREVAMLFYLSSTTIYRPDTTVYGMLAAANRNPGGVIVRSYVDRGTRRNETLVFDWSDESMFIYRRTGGAAGSWTRDTAKEWVFPSTHLSSAQYVTEAFDRIVIADRSEITFWSQASAPVRDSSATWRALRGRAISPAGTRPRLRNDFIEIVRGYGDELFTESSYFVGDSWGTNDGRTIFGTLVNNQGRSLQRATALNQGGANSDFGTVLNTWSRGSAYYLGPRPLAQWSTVIHRDSQGITGDDPMWGNRRAGAMLRAVDPSTDRCLTYGALSSSSIPQLVTPPIVRRNVSGTDPTLQIEADAWRLYTNSDDHFYVADITEDGTNTYLNTVKAYNILTLAEDTSRKFQLHSSFNHPANIANAQYTISFIYWARDRLFVQFIARIAGVEQAQSMTPQVLCYRKATTAPGNWVLSSEEDLIATTLPSDNSYACSIGSRIYILDPSLDTLLAYDFNLREEPHRNIALTSANADPVAVTADDTHLYVADSADSKVYTYRESDGRYIPTLDFPLTRSAGIVGMAYDLANSRMYVGYSNGADAYTVPGNQPPPIAAPEFDITISATTSPTGCASDGSTIWVSRSGTNVLHAYDVATLSRDSTRDIPSLPSTGGNYRGLTVEGGILYALSSDDNSVYAYDPRTRLRVQERDFVLPRVSGGAHGIASVGETLYALVDSAGTEEIIAYTQRLIRSITRPRESAAARVKAIGEAVAGHLLPSVIAGTRTLPQREIDGSLRDALRRCELSEIGRLVRGRLHPFGAWADNESTGPVDDLSEQPSALVISQDPDGATPGETPEYYENESLRINQVEVLDFEERGYTSIDPVSVGIWGTRSLRVDTDLPSTVTPSVAEWLLDTYVDSYPLLAVTADTLYEDSDTASLLMFARPHTPAYIAYRASDSYETDENPWLVLRREVVITPVPNLGPRAKFDFVFAPPYVFGVGWVLDGPSNLVQDRLDIDTLLIDGRY